MTTRPLPRYSTTVLWVGLFAALLIGPIFLESLCLGILYVRHVLKGDDTSSFAAEHLLTNLFVSAQRPPVPGKNFLGDLRLDRPMEWAQFLVPDDLLGNRLATGISAFFLDHSHKYLYVTDENGFIVDVNDPPITLQKPADVYRVIVLGGSTVMGQGAPRPSENLVGKLKKAVRERGLTGKGNKRVEFINAGVDAYNSAQEYLYLVSDLLRFKPDLVVVYDGWNDAVNDFEKSLSPFRTGPHIPNTVRLAQSLSIGGAAHLLASNLLYYLTESNFRIGMVELPWHAIRKLSSEARAAYSSTMPFNQNNAEFYRRNREAFLALASDQISVALFLQPLVGVDGRALSAQEKQSWWYPKFAEFLASRIEFYQHARHLLASLRKDRGDDHRCIADLSYSLNSVSETVYADSGHLLPKGNEVVAEHMLDQLVLCGLLQPTDLRLNW